MIHTYLPSVSGPPAPLAGMRSVIQEIDMASKPIEDPATQVAACDVPRAKLEVDTCVPRAKLDIDYLTVSDTTNMCLHMQQASASAWTAAQVWRPGNDFQGTQVWRPGNDFQGTQILRGWYEHFQE